MLFNYRGVGILNGGIANMAELFSVYVWFKSGEYHHELRQVKADRAVDRVRTLIQGPAARLGLVTRVMITDCLDRCCFEWIDGDIVFDGEKFTKIKT